MSEHLNAYTVLIQAANLVMLNNALKCSVAVVESKIRLTDANKNTTEIPLATAEFANAVKGMIDNIKQNKLSVKVENASP